jgi:hypothetical protein
MTDFRVVLLLERIADTLDRLVENTKPAPPTVFNVEVHNPPSLKELHAALLGGVSPAPPAYRDEPVLITPGVADRVFGRETWPSLMDYDLDAELGIPSGWRVLSEQAARELGEFTPVVSGRLVQADLDAGIYIEIDDWWDRYNAGELSIFSIESYPDNGPHAVLPKTWEGRVSGTGFYRLTSDGLAELGYTE